MNIRIYLFLVVSVLMFSSCDEESPMTEVDVNGLLVGTWTMSGLAYEGLSVVTDANGNMTETEFMGDAQEINNTLIFDEGPQVYTSAGSFTVSVTSELFGQEVNQELVFNNYLGDGTWEQNERVLITNDVNTGESSQVDILEITANSLILDFSTTMSMMVQDMQVEQEVSGAVIFRK